MASRKTEKRQTREIKKRKRKKNVFVCEKVCVDALEDTLRQTDRPCSFSNGAKLSIGETDTHRETH